MRADSRGTWRRRVTDFCGARVSFCFLPDTGPERRDTSRCLSRVCTLLLFKVRAIGWWKTRRIRSGRFAAVSSNEPRGPFYFYFLLLYPSDRPLFEYPMTLAGLADDDKKKRKKKIPSTDNFLRPWRALVCAAPRRLNDRILHLIRLFFPLLSFFVLKNYYISYVFDSSFCTSHLREGLKWRRLGRIGNTFGL